MAVTQVDIAKKLKTTHATVSRALRDDPSIAISTKIKIKKVAKDMGYKPDLLARALVKRKTNTIGMLFNPYPNPTTFAKLIALESACYLKRYKGFISYCSGSAKDFVNSAEELCSRGVDGLIVSSGDYHWTQRKNFDLIMQLPVPKVFLDEHIPFLCRQVYHDKSQGVKQAIRHLYNLGHRQINMVLNSWEKWINKDDPRFCGFREGIGNVGLNESECGIHELGCDGFIENGLWIYDPDSIAEGVQKFLTQKPNCTAIICSSDLIALSVISALKDMKIDVPEDISIVGVDNIVASTLCRPTLTTVGQPIEKLARAVVDLLISNIEQGDKSPRKVTINADLILRESVGSNKKS